MGVEPCFHRLKILLQMSCIMHQFLKLWVLFFGCIYTLVVHLGLIKTVDILPFIRSHLYDLQVCMRQVSI